MWRNGFRFRLWITCIVFLFAFSYSSNAQVRSPKRTHSVSHKKKPQQGSNTTSRSAQSSSGSKEGSQSIPSRRQSIPDRGTVELGSRRSNQSNVQQTQFAVQRDRNRPHVTSQKLDQLDENKSHQTATGWYPSERNLHGHEGRHHWHDPFFMLDMTVETMFQVKLTFPDSGCFFVMPRQFGPRLPSAHAQLSSLYMDGKPAVAVASFYLPYSRRNSAYFQSAQAYSGCHADKLQCDMFELGFGRVLASTSYSQAQLILGYHMGMEDWGTFAILRGVSLYRPFVCEGELKTSPMTRHFKVQGGVLWDVFEVFVGYCYAWRDGDFSDGFESGLRIWI